MRLLLLGLGYGFLSSLWAQQQSGPLSTMLAAHAQADAHGVAKQAQRIVTTIEAYRSDFGGVWPNPWRVAGVPEPESVSPEDDMLVTAAIFEWLAYTQDIAPALFGVTDERKPRQDAAAVIEHPDPAWALLYALDWTASKGSGSIRPVLSTRRSFEGQVAVVFGDTHLEWVQVQPVSDAALPRTWFPPGVEPLSAPNEFNGNDIFSPDAATELKAVWGKGDKRCAWMR